MLYPGIKLGSRDWLTKLNQSQTRHVEVWYRIDQPHNYLELFSALNDRGVRFGLHFWGTTTSGHEANLGYPEGLDESIQLVKTCLDDAAKHHATYVNIHSGNRCRFNLNLQNQAFSFDQKFPILSDPISTQTRNQALKHLGEYALNLNIKLLVEPIPQKISTTSASNYSDNTSLQHQYPTGLEGLLELCQSQLIGFTNDFCHLFAYYLDFDKFDSTTNLMAPYTFICHINTLHSPYNGTDSHNGILADDMKLPGVFPSTDKLLALLKQYQQIDHDIWLIGEPDTHHVENYHALQQLLTKI